MAAGALTSYYLRARMETPSEAPVPTSDVPGQVSSAPGSDSENVSALAELLS